MDNNRLEFKYLSLITGLFVAVLLISNIASVKILDLWKFTFDGGTLLFPLAYIFGDILTEVYGYKRSRKVIWTGFLSLLVANIVFYIVGILPPSVGWDNQEAYMNILGIIPRISIASLIAYVAGEFSNSFILAKMKIQSKGKYLWRRTIGSTLVGQFIDTGIFIMIAFYGIFPNSLIVSIIVSNYIFKVLIEVFFTPLTYMITNYLKKKENIDVYDERTNFNPFSFE